MAAPQPIEHPKPKAESRKPPAKKFEWHAATIKRSIPLGRMEGRREGGKEGGRGTRSSLSKQPIHSKRTRSARRTEQRTSVEEREVCPEAPIASVRSFALCNRLLAPVRVVRGAGRFFARQSGRVLQKHPRPGWVNGDVELPKSDLGGILNWKVSQSDSEEAN